MEVNTPSDPAETRRRATSLHEGGFKGTQKVNTVALGFLTFALDKFFIKEYYSLHQRKAVKIFGGKGGTDDGKGVVQ
ncbi:MAG: hypothetical protein Q4D58_09110 [Synergistaceae bacterium]|nr:hypothetical protein [Synergistaceae bacterium]